MAGLQISGRVLYANSEPARGARVRIYELDGLDGSAEHDLIMDTTSNGEGHYSGLSDDWNDREGQLFGANIPDVLRLQFLVTVNGQSHRGPLFRQTSTGRCADIVLPFPPPKPVGKAARELVQVIVLSKEYKGGEKALYQFIETSTEAMTSTVVGGLYRKVTFVKGEKATLDAFIKALRAATDEPATKAVDVLLTTHGSTDRLYFSDGPRHESAVLAALTQGLSASARRKLRVLFSTACFGKTHLDTWIAAGFNEASGSVGIYADSAVSYLPFLTAWAQEKTFEQAVAAANDADPLNLADTAARLYYQSVGKPNSAAQINSDRSRSGNGSTRIYTAP